jgi:hypothetical protein
MHSIASQKHAWLMGTVGVRKRKQARYPNMLILNILALFGYFLIIENAELCKQIFIQKP